MAALQDLNNGRSDPDECAHTSQACQDNHIRMGNQGQPFAAITISETKAELVLRTHCSDSHFIVFDVRATQQAVLIWGHWLETADAAECYCPKPFESLIALPHSVDPETLWIDIDPSARELVIKLAKQVSTQHAHNLVFANKLKLNCR